MTGELVDWVIRSKGIQSASHQYSASYIQNIQLSSYKSSMISESDFITIPYTPDMTQAGIKFACQSLSNISFHAKSNRYNHLRDIVARKAVALAFIRHLNHFQIPHEMLVSTPFTDPDHYDIAIGGRRCNINSFMLTQK